MLILMKIARNLNSSREWLNWHNLRNHTWRLRWSRRTTKSFICRKPMWRSTLWCRKRGWLGLGRTPPQKTSSLADRAPPLQASGPMTFSCQPQTGPSAECTVKCNISMASRTVSQFNATLSSFFYSKSPIMISISPPISTSWFYNSQGTRGCLRSPTLAAFSARSFGCRRNR